MRYAFNVLNLSDDEAIEFAKAIVSVKQDVALCEECQNISTDRICPICASAKRDKSVICVVEDPRSVVAIENTGHYNGVYHVLHGVISPMKGIAPEHLKIKELLRRLKGDEVKEVIIATNLKPEDFTFCHKAKDFTFFDVWLAFVLLAVICDEKTG